MKWRDKNFGKHPQDPEYDPYYDPDEDMERYLEEQEMKEDERRGK